MALVIGSPAPPLPDLDTFPSKPRRNPQGRPSFTVALGHRLNAQQRAELRTVIENFDNVTFSGFCMRAHSDSLLPGDVSELSELIENKITGCIELYVVDLENGFQAVTKTIVYPNSHTITKSSSVAIPIDSLHEATARKLKDLDRLEIFQLLPPRQRFLAGGEALWAADILRNADCLRKCAVALDILFDLKPALGALRSLKKLEGIELTHAVQSGGLSTMADLSPLLAQIHVISMTIPISFVSAGVLADIATIPGLGILVITTSGGEDPATHLAAALAEASIFSRGPERFEELNTLELRSLGGAPLDVCKDAVKTLRAIFGEVVYCEGNHLFVFRNYMFGTQTTLQCSPQSWKYSPVKTCLHT